jgi:quinol monooxygenase YgiN
VDHNRLSDKLLHEIASARARITANYARLWRGNTVHADSPPDGANGDDTRGVGGKRSSSWVANYGAGRTQDKEKRMAVTVGILALLEAKPDKAQELADFLKQGRELALAEPQTVTWYAFKLDDVTYGIFDTFEAEDGRQAHLGGEVAKALMAAAPELLAKDPDIRPVEIVAVK